MRRKFVVCWLFTTVFSLSGTLTLSAWAEQRDPAGAQALFDQARLLTQQGHYAEACPKLLESNRLDPGIGTQFYLADCYEHSGQIATAWATFLDVASIAHASAQSERETVALRRAAQLEARLPRLVINVPAASQLEGLEIHRDEVLVGAAQWGTPLPIDPGEHALRVSAPGRTELTETLKLEEGKPLTFDVPALASAEKTAAVPEPVVVPPPPAPTPVPPPPAAKSKVDAWPLVLAGAGVVGLGVGSVFALKAVSSNSESKKSCPSSVNVCNSDGVNLRNDALQQGNVASVGFIAGGAFLAAALIVWRVEVGSRTAGAAAPVVLHARTAVAPGNAALYLQGDF